MIHPISDEPKISQIPLSLPQQVNRYRKAADNLNNGSFNTTVPNCITSPSAGVCQQAQPTAPTWPSCPATGAVLPTFTYGEGGL